MGLFIFLTGLNLVIAAGYFLLAYFFGSKVRLPQGWKRGWRVVVTCIFAALFFVGCAHTHLDLAYDAYHHTLSGHWLEPFNVVSHVLQAIGGLGFYLCGTWWVKINIFDKRSYEEFTKDIEREVKLMEIDST